jgi:hypothetical protein
MSKVREYAAIHARLPKEETMIKKRIHYLVVLTLALALILGNIIPTQAAPSAAAMGPSVYWGALVEGKVPSTTNLQGVFNTFETRSGKKMSIIHWGQPWVMPDGSWGEFQTGYFDNVRNHGSIPMINWASQKLGDGIIQPNFQLRDIYNGTYDAYITRWATAARNWGHPFFLYFDHEMNGWWLPWAEGKTSNGTVINGNSSGDFVKAWRHVHDIFTSVGATNVSWVWGPNHMSTSSQYPPLSTLYPGDAYVDWTGLSVYNKYNTWAGLNPLLTGSSGQTWFRNSYNEVLSLAPNKPMMLAQWASVEAGDGGAKKAAWITDALTTQIPVNFPKIKAVVWLNWMETPNETYPIESSPAATAAWAAGIASPVYAANQYASLNKSPIPPPDAGVVISGSAGIQGVTLSYTDGIAKTSTSGPNGAYSITVPANWSGTVTPAHACYTFNPTSLNYSSVSADQPNKNYSATVNPAAGCVGVDVAVGGSTVGGYYVAPNGGMRTSYAGANSGPARVISTNNKAVVASQRVIYGGGSYSEMMGLPFEQLSKEYLFPYYNNVAMDSQLRVSNVGGADTTITVYLGTQQIDQYTLAAGGATRKNYPGKNSGPLRVTSSSSNILATIRVLYAGSSYSELMGFPANVLANEYLFPYYNNVAMDSQLRVSNVGGADTTITVYLGTQQIDQYTLAAGGASRKNYTGKNSGPLRVTSSDSNILTTIRVLYAGTSLSELMGFPAGQLSQSYWYPVYDNAAVDSQLRVSNVGTATTTITVYAGSEQIDSYELGKGAASRKNYPRNTGPLHVVSSTQPILTTVRLLYGSSLYEMTGLPESQLSTQYFFPWYNNKAMDSELRFAVP